MSWHGLCAVLGVSFAVYLVARWAPAKGISSDAVYSTAIWAILGGILGARVVHVLDQWEFYSSNPVQIVSLWRGGVGVWGGILGGFIGGLLYARWANLPWRQLADLTAPAMLLGQAIGRVGDIINGEHFAEPTSLPWGFVYTHPSTQALYQNSGLNSATPTHPAVLYELLWDLLVFGFLWWFLRKHLEPHGMLFTAYLALYAGGRFFISFFRLDRNWVGDLNEAQIISLVVLLICVPIIGLKAKLTGKNVAHK